MMDHRERLVLASSRGRIRDPPTVRRPGTDNAGTVRVMTTLAPDTAPRWSPVRWVREHPDGADALLGTALAVIAVIGMLTIDTDALGDTARESDALGIALGVVPPLLLAIRRRHPVLTLWLSAAVVIPFWVLEYADVTTSLALLVHSYTVAAHLERPKSIVHAVATGTVLIGVMIIGVFAEDTDLPAIAVVGNVIVFGTAWLLGDSLRNRRAYLAEVEARVERAEVDRIAAVERAARDERTRIARDLHDVVAHAVSVMVVQAGAARRILDRDPASASHALLQVETTGREALQELRSVLGVPRDGDGVSTEPQPSGAKVTDLVERVRAAGLDVDLHIEGDPGALPPGVGITVFRVVQESLTNVVKHAGPARADVHVEIGSEHVDVQVVDDGRGPAARDGDSGQGHIGMRERVEAFGGDLDVGPRPGGGFRVRARVPFEARA